MRQLLASTFSGDQSAIHSALDSRRYITLIGNRDLLRQRWQAVSVALITGSISE